MIRHEKKCRFFFVVVGQGHIHGMIMCANLAPFIFLPLITLQPAFLLKTFVDLGAFILIYTLPNFVSSHAFHHIKKQYIFDVFVMYYTEFPCILYFIIWAWHVHIVELFRFRSINSLMESSQFLAVIILKVSY